MDLIGNRPNSKRNKDEIYLSFEEGIYRCALPKATVKDIPVIANAEDLTPEEEEAAKVRKSFGVNPLKAEEIPDVTEHKTEYPTPVDKFAEENILPKFKKLKEKLSGTQKTGSAIDLTGSIKTGKNIVEGVKDIYDIGKKSKELAENVPVGVYKGAKKLTGIGSIRNRLLRAYSKILKAKYPNYQPRGVLGTEARKA